MCSPAHGLQQSHVLHVLSWLRDAGPPAAAQSETAQPLALWLRCERFPPVPPPGQLAYGRARRGCRRSASTHCSCLCTALCRRSPEGQGGVAPLGRTRLWPPQECRLNARVRARSADLFVCTGLLRARSKRGNRSCTRSSFRHEIRTAPRLSRISRFRPVDRKLMSVQDQVPK